MFQGLSLTVLIRRLGVVDDGLANVEERTARLKANEAALAYLAELDSRFPRDIVERLRVEYDDRIRQLELCACTGGDRSDGLIAPSYQRLHFPNIVRILPALLCRYEEHLDIQNHRVGIETTRLISESGQARAAIQRSLAR
jgi:hypothetical protein